MAVQRERRVGYRGVRESFRAVAQVVRWGGDDPMSGGTMRRKLR